MTPDDLIAWRRKMRWTQAEAAEQLGYCAMQYARIERGVVKPRWRLLDLACSRLWDDKKTAMERGWAAADRRNVA